MTNEARVLHVLPHPGGGGERYVDCLAQMEGYHIERRYIASRPELRAEALRGGLRAQLGSRHYELLHVHGEVASAICLSSLALRPSIVTTHGLNVVRRLVGWRKGVAEANLRVIVRAASATICVGEAELEDVRAVVGESPRLALIQNGVDGPHLPNADERAAARAEFGLGPTVNVGVYLGALDRHKEPIVAAQAALAVEGAGVPIVLLIAGDGPLRAELGAIVGESTAVRLLGFQLDVRPVLAAADFFVLPSQHEGLSFALLEAMSLGLPAVVSDAPGNLEVVGDAGIVAPRGDVAAFASAFKRLCLDQSERGVLGERAAVRVAERYSQKVMVQRTREIYDRAMQEGASIKPIWRLKHGAEGDR